MGRILRDFGRPRRLNTRFHLQRKTVRALHRNEVFVGERSAVPPRYRSLTSRNQRRLRDREDAPVWTRVADQFCSIASAHAPASRWHVGFHLTPRFVMQAKHKNGLATTGLTTRAFPPAGRLFPATHYALQSRLKDGLKCSNISVPNAQCCTGGRTR